MAIVGRDSRNSSPSLCKISIVEEGVAAAPLRAICPLADADAARIKA